MSSIKSILKKLRESRINEAEGDTLWMGKYKPVHLPRPGSHRRPGSPVEIKKVVFYAGDDIQDAEDELEAILPPYSECKVLGRAPSLQKCLDDGFELIKPANESESPELSNKELKFIKDFKAYWDSMSDEEKEQSVEYVKSKGDMTIPAEEWAYDQNLEGDIDKVKSMLINMTLNNGNYEPTNLSESGEGMNRAEMLDKIRSEYHKNYKLKGKTDQQVYNTLNRLKKEEDKEDAEREMAKENKDKFEGKCEECGTVLTDSGECPKCDLHLEEANESANFRTYISVEYTYNGDDVSNYLGHVKVRTDKEDVALYAAEKYAMSKHPEDDPRHFTISKDDYTNVDVVDDHGEFLTHLEESNDSPSFNIGDVVEWSGLYGGQYTGKVTDIGYSMIRLEVSWVAEDTGKTITKDMTYAKDTDPQGNECIIVWEYHGEKGYLYPPEKSVSESSDLEDIQNAPHSSSFMKDRGEVEIKGESYVKIGKNKWEHHPKNPKALGSTYSDKEIYDMMNESKDADSIAQEIESKIKKALDDFMMSPEIGFLEDEVDEYSRVEVDPYYTSEYGNYVEVEVRAELGYVALSKLCDVLNPIVANYDKESYFEPQIPGIIVAYVTV